MTSLITRPPAVRYRADSISIHSVSLDTHIPWTGTRCSSKEASGGARSLSTGAEHQKKFISYVFNMSVV